MFPEIPSDLSALSDEELAQLHDELVAAFNEATSEDAVPSEDVIAELATVTDGVERIRTEQGARSEHAAALLDQVSQLANRVNASQDGDDEGEGEGEGEPAPEGEGAERPANQDGQPQIPAEGPAAADTGQRVVHEEGQVIPNPAAEGQASSRAVTAGATLSQAQRRTPARTRPRPQAPAEGEVSIIAAAGIPGIQPGSDVRTLRDVSEMLITAAGRLGRGGNGDDSVPVVQFRVDFPDERRLSPDMSSTEVMDRINSFNRTPDGITAAGGLCAPVNSYYDQAVIAEADRPVRDALANFGADRGGIRFNPPPKLSQITSGIGIITVAQDAAGSPTKNCFTVTCNAPTEVDVSAIYNCLQFGNFGARTFPELVEAWTKLALAVQARTAEQMLLDGIAAASTTVTTAGLVGGSREILARLGQAAAGYRSRNRMRPETPLRVLLPTWVLDMAQADIVRTLGGPLPENASVARAQIAAWFGARNLNVSWYMDSKTGGGQVFGTAQGGQVYGDVVTTSGQATITSATAAFTSADVGKTITGTGIPASTTILSVQSATGATMSANATATATGVSATIGRTTLAQFPTQVYAYLFHEGAFLHLDAGTLDLGLVRDSTLNAGNNFRMFTETFENVAFVGVESNEIVMTLNADGSYAAAKSITTPINS